MITRVLLLSVFTLATVVGCVSDADPGDDGDHEDEPAGQTAAELISAVSCHEHAETAYRGGRASPIRVITVGGKQITRPTGHAFLRMQRAADAAGVSLSLTSGFRTMAEQKYLYGCYRSGRCNGGNLAAAPGYSNHQSGTAVDVTTSAWLARNASHFGFVRTVPSEAWHYEYTGGRDPGGPCSDDAGEGDGLFHPEKLAWRSPAADGRYAHDVTMTVSAADAAIVKVVYRWGARDLGSSTDRVNGFPFVHGFKDDGERTLTAIGYSASNERLAQVNVDVELVP